MKIPITKKTDSALLCINEVRANTDEVIVMCSLGKDSIVVLDMIHPYFNKIYCVFMYFVKDLEHINRWINWVKAKYPKVEFVQMPHWNLTYILRSGLYCVPQPKIKLLSLTDVCNAMRKKFNCEYVFLGMKRADSMNRRLFLETYRENNFINMGMAYPLSDWTQKDVLSYMKQHRLPEPVRYSKSASSGLGFNADCFLWMREKFPQDLEKIYKTFPLSRRILLEYDLKKQKEEQGE